MAPIEKKSSLLFDIKEYYSESENSPNWTVLLFLQMSNIVDKVVLLWKLSFSSSIMPSKKKNLSFVLWRFIPFVNLLLHHTLVLHIGTREDL